MKVFVSGQIGEKDRIREIYSRLQEEGLVITHDWTRTDDLAVTDKFSPEAGERAAKDIGGVCDADIYIVVTDNEKCGKGMYVELGAALALVQIGRRISIYVVGPMKHPSIFYSHPAVTHFNELEDCINDIKLSVSKSTARNLQVA